MASPAASPPPALAPTIAALAALRTAAGLDAKAPQLGGWDKDKGRSLTGHIAGHLLSALSLMYAATGDARIERKDASAQGFEQRDRHAFVVAGEEDDVPAIEDSPQFRAALTAVRR